MNEHLAESQRIWETIAPEWDANIGAEGNSYHNHLIAPATRTLLDAQQGERVLDVACGNGQFSREMAQLGARVTASDYLTPAFAAGLMLDGIIEPTMPAEQFKNSKQFPWYQEIPPVLICRLRKTMT